jgi:DNA-binding transcriptional MerR regulator
MANDAERFSLDELCTLTELPRRTVRYYIQEGLVDRPEGAKRGAYYTRVHLEQLLTIRKWQRAGLGLERIRELVSGRPEGAELPPERPRRPGDLTVRSHIWLRPGVELVVEPEAARLTPEEVRAFAEEAAALLDELTTDSSR